MQGAEHLRNLQNETKGSRTPEDFHIELLRLRQNWRLKKVGNTILGDLSYRTAGSAFKQSGVFEVSKADENLDTQSTPTSGANGGSGKVKSALKVTVPSELEGIAYIQVTIQRDTEQLVSATIGHFSPGAQKPAELHWQNKLEAAQNVLFCKELFSQLAREAVGLQAPIPHMVVGSQITASLFPDIQLIVSLCHSTGGQDKKGEKGGTSPQSRNDHRHVLLRLRTIFVLDTLAREFKDPLLTSHWSTLSSPTCSSVKVSVVSAGYDTIIKTQLVIHVGEKMLRVICKDGRVLNFSYEPQELRDFILCQISQHQVTGVQALARVMGWQVMASSCFLGSGAIEPFGSAAGCLLANSKGDKFVAVRHSPQANASVFVSQAPSSDFFATPVIQASKWENLPEGFKQLKLDKMDGKNLVNKIELLMAALS